MSDDEPIIVHDVFVRRPWPALRLIRGVLGLSAAIALLFGPTAPTLALALVLGAAFVLVKWASDRARPATLRVAAHEVSIDSAGGVSVIPRHALRRAFMLVQGPRVALALEPRFGRPIEAEFAVVGEPARKQVERCLALLAFDTDQRVLAFATPTLSLRTITRWTLGVIVGAALGLVVWLVIADALELGSARHWVGAIPVAALIAWATARGQRDVAFYVGADGVEVRMPWGRRFIPYGRLRRLTWVPPETLIIDEEGQSPWTLEGSALTNHLGSGEAFVLAVERAGERYREARHDAGMAEVIARRGRPLGEWRAALHALVGVGGGYRAQAVRGAELAGLVDDPTAPEELRVGAALALRAMNPEAEVTRIRVAAEACAHAPLREALERAADDTLDEAALAKLRRAPWR